MALGDEEDDMKDMGDEDEICERSPSSATW
jgi:hypothetical protein